MKTGEPHRHPAWAWVRGAIVAVNGVWGVVAPPAHAVPDLTWTDVLIGAAFMLFTPIVLIAGNPLLPDQAPPSWRANPFSLSQPVQFFHMAAWAFMAAGLGALAAVLARGDAVGPDAVVLVATGGALWAATRVIPPVRRHEPPDGTEAAG